VGERPPDRPRLDATLRSVCVKPDQLNIVQRQQRLPDQIAAAIEALIATRQVAPGDRLPTERVLCARFGVSRTVVREAVRSLETKGLVEGRAGSGVYVTKQSAQPAAQLLGLAIQSDAELTWADVMEARRALEIEIAGLAAQRRTDADLAALRRALDDHRAALGASDRAGVAAHADVRFHAALAVASHNGVMPILLGAIEGVLLEARRVSMRLERALREGITHHARILRAVNKGDFDGAYAAQRHPSQPIPRTLASFVSHPKATNCLPTRRRKLTAGSACRCAAYFPIAPPKSVYIYREAEVLIQPQFHAGLGLTRRISPRRCCTTMQGPSHETQSRSPQGIARHRSRAICRPNAWCGMVLNSAAHAPSPLPVVLPLRQHNSDATGYTGLRRATQNRPRARRHAQNASI